MSAHACACCGSSLFPRRPQWWNQDTGYGMCDKCAGSILHLPGFKPLGSSPFPRPEFERAYGKPGVHYTLPESSAVLNVACPSCLAGVGVPCVGLRPGWHCDPRYVSATAIIQGARA